MRKLLPLTLSLLVLAATAIEPPQAPPGSPPKDAQAQPAPPAPAPDPAPEPEDGPAAGAEAPDAEEELPPLPPDVAPAGPSPQRFNPTEKVRADFPVSFPIDI